MMKEKKRNLKVYYKYRSRQKDYFHHEYRKVPTITLSGDWLAACGFNVDDNIAVSVENGKLVIERAD